MNDAVRVVCGVMWPRDSLVSREVPLCSVLQHKDTSESVSPREAIDFSTVHCLLVSLCSLGYLGLCLIRLPGHPVLYCLPVR